MPGPIADRITQIGASSDAYGGSGTSTATFSAQPAGTLLVAAAINTATTDTVVSTGWTRLGGHTFTSIGNYTLFAKVAAGSETSFVIDHTGGSPYEYDLIVVALDPRDTLSGLGSMLDGTPTVDDQADTSPYAMGAIDPTGAVDARIDLMSGGRAINSPPAIADSNVTDSVNLGDAAGTAFNGAYSLWAYRVPRSDSSAYGATYTATTGAVAGGLSLLVRLQAGGWHWQRVGFGDS